MGSSRPTSSSCPSFLAARWRCVTRVDLRKYGATVGCAVCSGIVVHGQRAKPHTDECRARIGKHMEHDPQGHERLQDERMEARCGR